MKMIHGMMEIQDFNHDKSGKPRRRQCKKKWMSLLVASPYLQVV
jgi:hypothetical protein